nr:5-carboxymethyl-2-hydroxymuconate Delta-isomerase [Mesobacterium pallidum]
MAIEYAPSLDRYADIADVCRALHAEMMQIDLFPLAGIRVRAYRADFAIVADGLDQNAFVAMTLNVGAGRSEAKLKAAGDRLFAVAQQALSVPLATQHFALSLEIRQIDPVLTWKQTPIHTRLKGKS